VRELDSLGDERALAAAWFLVASAENLRANWQGQASAVEHLSEHARGAGDRRLETDALRGLSATIFWGVTPISSGLPRLEVMLERAAGNKYLEAMVSRSIAGFYAMQGNFDEGRALLVHARALLEELGRPLEVSGLGFFTGPLELLAGDPAAAEREFRTACEAFEARGEKGFLSTLAALLAEALYALDRLDDAEAEVRRSMDAATSDDHNAQALRRSVEGRILARRGRLDDAERVAREAVALIDRTDELNHQAQVRMALGEVLELAKRPAEALSVVEEARRFFEQKGNVVSSAQAGELLEQLQAQVG
jgi:tetratricopeptide (TPR) repeat protein